MGVHTHECVCVCVCIMSYMLELWAPTRILATKPQTFSMLPGGTSHKLLSKQKEPLLFEKV